MAQIFPKSANTAARLSILFAVLLVGAGVGAIMAFERSPYRTNQGVVYEQPVKFSHDHHTAALGIDCRYCHTSVETSSFAGIPPTEVCMNCHKEIWKDSPMLEPVRASFRDGVPLQWWRVNDLPDFVHFNHSIHVAKGVGCVVCHGRVDEMPLLERAAPLQMRWCLDCHRHPAPNLRPTDEVTNMTWQPPAGGPAYGERLAREAGVDGEWRLAGSCSTCHY